MLITKVSQLTGMRHTRDIDVTNEQIDAWQQGALIQDVMPDLSPDNREFIMTGITATEWADTFGSDDDVHTDDIPDGVDMTGGNNRQFTEGEKS